MTIITYRDGIMAADSNMNYNGFRMASSKKIHRLAGGELIGFAGAATLCHELFLYFASDNYRKKLTQFRSTIASDDNYFAQGLFVYPSGAVSFFNSTAILVPISGPFFAEGRGAEFAMGAMMHGATAIEAALYACNWVEGCKGPVESLVLGDGGGP